MTKLFFAPFLLVLAVWGIIKKPHYFIAIVFGLFLYRLNFSIAYGINLRLLLSVFVILIISLKFPKQLKYSIMQIFSSKLFILFLLFNCYNVFLTYYNFGETVLVKSLAVTTALFVLGYIYNLFSTSYKPIVFASILAGFLTFADLIFSFVYFGYKSNLKVHTIIDFFINGQLSNSNHGPIGSICALALLVVFCSFKPKLKIIKYAIMSILFGGVVISTSRSALLGLIASFAFIIFYYNRISLSKLLKLSFLLFSVILVSYLAIYIVPGFIGFNDKITELIHKRVVRKPLEYVMNDKSVISDASSIEWREKSWKMAISAYNDLKLEKQIFGLGNAGFQKKISGLLTVHNLFLQALIDQGAIGLVLVIFFTFALILKVFSVSQNQIYFAFGAIIGIYLIFYSFSQQRQIFDPIACFFYGQLIWVQKNKIRLLEEK